MIKSAPELLTVQKLVYLLNDSYFRELSLHLENIKAALPLKMIHAVRAKLPDFHTPDELCKAVYGSAEEAERKKFNQLSSHTLRLTEFLAINFPRYLHPNILTIQDSIYEGNWEHALQRAEMLLSIADKIDDFKCQILCCKLLAERSFSERDIPAGFRYDARILVAIENEKELAVIQSKIRQTLNVERRIDPSVITEVKALLKSYHNHDKASIRILSLFGYLRVIFLHELRTFESIEGSPLIDQVTKELTNHPHVILPFLADIKGHLLFMQLNSGLHAIDSKERKNLFAELKEHYRFHKAKSGTLSPGQLHLMAVQSTHFFTLYHHLVNRKDYAALMPPKQREELDELLATLQGYLDLPPEARLPDYQKRSLWMLYGAMLIISGGKTIKRGIAELEALLTAYQQVNLASSTDSIFLALMIGYFSIEDYDGCANTFKRFTKIKNSKTVYEGNDIKIHAYYYLSQFLSSNRAQYIVKMKELIASLEEPTVPKSIGELYRQFGIDL
jgi:hypothetical protein